MSKPGKIDGKRRQWADIYYNAIGLRAALEPETLEQEYAARYQSTQKRRKKTA